MADRAFVWPLMNRQWAVTILWSEMVILLVTTIENGRLGDRINGSE